jgi:hypothetical protein
MLDMAVDVIIAARKESTNSRIQRDTMAVILNGLPSGHTRDMIYNREKRQRRVEVEILDTTNDASELVPALGNKGGRPLGATKEALPELVPALRNMGGRPLGATNEAVPELVPALSSKGGRPLEATNEAKRDREGREHKAKAYAVETLLARWARREPGKRSGKKRTNLIIEAAKKNFNVEDLVIRESMIWDRATRGKFSNPRGERRGFAIARDRASAGNFCRLSVEGRANAQLNKMSRACKLIDKGNSARRKDIWVQERRQEWCSKRE